MKGDLEKLAEIEKKKEVDRSKTVEKIEKMSTGGNKLLQIDLDSKINALRDMQEGNDSEGGVASRVLRAIWWGQNHVWDRSYLPKYDFNLTQRSKIINYCYDRFTMRAGRVSKKVAGLNYVPHVERLKSRDPKVGSIYLATGEVHG